nr:LytTR family DNA-binding domain-containing protein [Enterococcus sp. MSG2901]
MDFIIKNEVSTVCEKIRECIDLASDRFLFSETSQSDTILIKVNGILKKVNLKEIMFFETSLNAHKVVLHMRNGQLEFFGKISELAEKNEKLVRCHRSILINLQNISSFDKRNKEIIFDNEERCRVAIRYLSLVSKIL